MNEIHHFPLPYPIPEGWTVRYETAKYYTHMYFAPGYEHVVVIRKDNECCCLSPSMSGPYDDSGDVPYPSFDAAVAAVTLMEGVK